MIATVLRRGIRQHLPGFLIATLCVALSCGLLLSVWTLREQASEAFASYSGGYDAVVTARGSKLQAVLNAVFHLDHAPGLLSHEDYEALRKHPAVAAAVPLASGDSYLGWRVVGTTQDYFELSRLSGGAKPQVQAGGRWFDPEKEEAVLGETVARRCGLKVGDHFHPSHGVAEAGGHEHEESFVVVGILQPTRSPMDRVAWIPLHGLQTLGGHDEAHAEDLSAALIKLRSPAAGFLLERQLNREGSRLTFAFPIGASVAELFQRFSWVEKVLSGVAWLVALVAAGTVFASISSTLQGRRRELAILRSLGATRTKLFTLMFSEAALIGLGGALLGLLLHALFSSVAVWLIREQTGMQLEIWAMNASYVIMPLASLGLSLFAGFWPAWTASRLSVVDGLAPES